MALKFHGHLELDSYNKQQAENREGVTSGRVIELGRPSGGVQARSRTAYDQTLVPNNLSKSTHSLVLGPVYIENLHYEHHEHRYAEDANLKYYQTQVTRDQSQLDETRTAYEQIRKERDTLKASFDAVQSEMNRYKIGYSTEFEQHKATKGEKEQLSKRVSDLEQEKYVFQINELELRKQLEHAKRGWQICYDSNKTRNASRTGL